ncbi:MAG: LamG domain-containing protein [Myxococcota bacterium]
MRGVWSAAAIVAFGASCARPTPFVCATDSQCEGADGRGRCEADGFCSVPDASCESGHRYSALSGPDHAGLCVAAVAGDSTGTAPGGSSTDIGGGTATGTTSGPSVDVTGGSGSDTLTTSGTSSTRGTTRGDPSTGSTTGGGLDPDLVAWYRMDALAGDGVLDSTAHGHDGTCADCPAEVAGTIDGALELDGMGQFVVVPYDPAFDIQTWTLSAWIWVGSEPAGFRTIVGKPLGIGVANSWELGVNQGMAGARLVAGWSDGPGYQGLDFTLPGIQQWVFVAATVSDDTATLYIGDTVVDEKVLAIQSEFDASDIHIGADIDDQMLDNFFHGRMDDVRIYARALTTEELGIVMQGDNL